MIGASPPLQECPRSISRSTAASGHSSGKGIPAPAARLMKQYPLRLQYSAFADSNPLMGLVRVAADQVRENRKPARPTIRSLPSRRPFRSRSSGCWTAGGT